MRLPPIISPTRYQIRLATRRPGASIIQIELSVQLAPLAPSAETTPPPVIASHGTDKCSPTRDAVKPRSIGVAPTTYRRFSLECNRLCDIRVIRADQFGPTPCTSERAPVTIRASPDMTRVGSRPEPSVLPR